MVSVIFDEWMNEYRGWNRSYKKHLRRCFYYLEIKMLISLLLFFFLQIMYDVISRLGFSFCESYKEQCRWQQFPEKNEWGLQKIQILWRNRRKNCGIAHCERLKYCLWVAAFLKYAFLFICRGGIFSGNRKYVLSAFKLYFIILSWECSASW